MNTLLLWDEGGIAFGDLTFRNRPLLGTATAIVVDCQFLDRDGQKVDQRKLTVEGPVYGRDFKRANSDNGVVRRCGGNARPQHRARPRNQLADTKRFDDIVIRAEFEQPDLFALP
jgi:hypothetical protein